MGQVAEPPAAPGAVAGGGRRGTGGTGADGTGADAGRGHDGAAEPGRVEGLLGRGRSAARSARAFGRSVAADAPMSRVLLGTGVAAAVVVLGLMHRGAVDAGGQSLADADWDWLLLAVLATTAMWGVGTVTQLGSMPVSPPVGRVFAVQVAASFVNHLLPAGSGGIAVNVRFLRRCGLTRGAAVGSVGLNSLAGLVTHMVLLVVAVAAVPSTMGMLDGRLPRVSRQQAADAVLGNAWAALAVVAAVAAAAAALVWLRPARWARSLGARGARGWAHLKRELATLRDVLRHPGRATALWVGSAAAPLLHGIVLFAVLRSIDVSITATSAVVVYLVVSSVSALLPSPGGIGGLDVVLVAGLAWAGVPSAAALGAVLGYRMITVWLPLVPGACVFAVLLRRKII
ncbi:lysylphosphatidylglycerol synthase transmembrane domain-containing protein [Actinomadura roseirufa]|uniref:lysylphosphatidylglycerol synthase transmembrane domain-containing protein n=1 Tax=Actinomadura roseirufa TaxID=2094049 RepID=UPI0013F16934|nr:lysylphosphatidylglycerol synthase transmembrane domain-containing protein [Actinomadura roseirufa]